MVNWTKKWRYINQLYQQVIAPSAGIMVNLRPNFAKRQLRHITDTSTAKYKFLVTIFRVGLK